MCSDVFLDVAVAEIAALELFATQLRSQLIKAGEEPRVYEGPRREQVWLDEQLAVRAHQLRERVCAQGQYLLARGLAHCGHGQSVRESSTSGGSAVPQR